MKSKFAILFLVFLPFASLSQTKWNITFGTEEFTGLIRKNLPEDLPEKIVQNSVGEYFISGTNNLRDGEPKPESMGAWIAKFSAEGKFLWFRVGDPSFLKCVPDQLAATLDGGAVLAGYEDGAAPDYNVDGLILYKYNQTGELLKKTHFAKSFNVGNIKAEKGGRPIFTFENSEGNISVIASVSVRQKVVKNGQNYSELNSQNWILNFSPTFEFINATVLEIPDISISVYDFTVFTKFDNRFCSDGSFSIIKKDRENNQFFTLYKFDKTGKKLWSADKTYSGPILYYGITHLPSGKPLVFANVDINNANNAGDLYTVFNEAGEQESEFKTKYEGFITDVISVEDDYIVNFQFGLGEGKFGLKKINSQGKELWRKTFGVKSSLSINCIPALDKGFALLAYTKEYNANYIDALFIKTDENGNTDLVPKKYAKANP